jgi:hypothetical protein
MNDRPNAALGQLKYRQSDGQAEAPRPGAPWIEVEHAVNGLDPRPVGVAGNNHVDTAGYGIEFQLMDIMQNVDGPAAKLDRSRRGIARRPIGGVHVPPDRNDGRDPAQLGNDLRPADIAGVDDMLNTGKALLRLGAQQAVRVRNDSDPHLIRQLFLMRKI